MYLVDHRSPFSGLADFAGARDRSMQNDECRLQIGEGLMQAAGGWSVRSLVSVASVLGYNE
jgi:hypothetical protein